MCARCQRRQQLSQLLQLRQLLLLLVRQSALQLMQTRSLKKRRKKWKRRRETRRTLPNRSSSFLLYVVPKIKRRLEIPCSLLWARFTIHLTTLQTDFSLFKTDQKAERTEYSVFITLPFLPATVHRKLPKCLSETNVLQVMQTA